MNAFGDATMALALFILIAHTNSLSFGRPRRRTLSQTTANLVALGLLGGAVAKSAQIPLQTWLPDAMEGPTPVSALIHAATMVTAGVYLIARTHADLRAGADDRARSPPGIGALTLLVAGLIALVQTDIKRVIAYSTMSQIGYMFLGRRRRRVRERDVPPHDARLLQGAALHDGGPRDPRARGRAGHPQDARAREGDAVDEVVLPRRRARARRHPAVRRLLLEGPDHRRRRSHDGTGTAVVFWLCGLAGAFLTGLYTFRLWFIVFPGEPSAFVREHHHAHHGTGRAVDDARAGRVLAVLATFGGWIQFPPHWEPITELARSRSRRRSPAAVPTNDAGDASRPIVAVLARPRRHRRSPGRSTPRTRLAIPKMPCRPARCSSTSSTSTSSYDRIFYTPAAAIADASAARVRGARRSSRPAPTSARRRSTPAESSGGSRPACSARTSSSSPPARPILVLAFLVAK